MKKYDLIIIGGGPSGINCGIEASKKGVDYMILEKGVLVNSLFNFPSNMQFFSTSVNLEIGEIPFISHTDKPTRKEALEYYRRLYDYYNLNVSFRTKVVQLKKGNNEFIVQTNNGDLRSKNVVCATGFYDSPNYLHVPGENLPKVKHYYDEAHHYIGQNIVVVGGANSACDVALETWQKGANVTMVIRKPELYEKVKYWILPNIQNRIKEGSIKAFFNSTITEIKEEEVLVKTPDGETRIPNDYVLAMTGYSPDYKLLEKFGITIQNDNHRTPKFDKDSLQSEVEGLYLMGTVLGGLHTSKYFIENTREQAVQIIDHIIKVKK